LILRTSHHVKDLNVVGILINNNENMKKIQFKAGRIPNVIHFFPYIRISRGEYAANWKRFAIEIGFWYWAIGWFFALIPYCDKCGAYLKCDCNCDDDWLDLDDDEYED
jgi:hypothetical protein